MVLSFEQTRYIVCVYMTSVIITRFDLDVVTRQLSQSLCSCQILHSHKKIGAVYIYRIFVDDMGVNSCFVF